MRDENGNRETVENLCTACKRTFKTLADEKDDICGNCHQEIYEQETTNSKGERM
jgi:hypothetical protein